MKLPPIAKAHAEVTQASVPFESRWTLRALLVHDRELYDRFREQQVLWCASLMGEDKDEIEEHTGGMCRAWAAVTRAMEEAGIEDTAYLIGRDDEHGVTVAIAEQEAVRERVRDLYGEHVIFMRPSEVATLLARHAGILDLKRLLPGAELLASLPPEPAPPEPDLLTPLVPASPPDFVLKR